VDEKNYDDDLEIRFKTEKWCATMKKMRMYINLCCFSAQKKVLNYKYERHKYYSRLAAHLQNILP